MYSVFPLQYPIEGSKDKYQLKVMKDYNDKHRMVKSVSMQFFLADGKDAVFIKQLNLVACGDKSGMLFICYICIRLKSVYWKMFVNI